MYLIPLVNLKHMENLHAFKKKKTSKTTKNSISDGLLSYGVGKILVYFQFSFIFSHI